MVEGNKKELISIILPTYNSGLYISDAINSVINQTYTKWECLIVDDGSQDKTKDIIQSFIQNDSRIRYFFQENAGQAQARNLGVNNSKGKFIAFIDSDDMWLDNMLEVSLNEFAKKEQDVLFSNSYLFVEGKDNPTNLSKLSHFGIHSETYEGEIGLKRFIQQNRISMDGVFMTKKSFLKVGGFRNESRGEAEDYELWLNMLAIGCTLRGIENKLSIVRKHTESTMATTNINVKVISMLERFFSTHTNINPITYRNEISDWLGMALSYSKNKDEIFHVFNKKNLDTFSFNIKNINIISNLRGILPIKFIKKIFFMYLKYFDKKYNG